MEEKVRYRIGAWLVVGAAAVWCVAPACLFLGGSYGFYAGIYVVPFAIGMMIGGNVLAPQVLTRKILFATALAWAALTAFSWGYSQARWSHVPPGTAFYSESFSRFSAEVRAGKVPMDREGNFLYPLVLTHAPALDAGEIRYGITKDRGVAIRHWQEDEPLLEARRRDVNYYLPKGATGVQIRRYGPLDALLVGVVSVGVNLGIAALANRRHGPKVAVGGAA